MGNTGAESSEWKQRLTMMSRMTTWGDSFLIMTAARATRKGRQLRAYVRTRARKRTLKGLDDGWHAKEEGMRKHSIAKINVFRRKCAGKKEDTREHAMQVPGGSSVL
jgi:hypothetical protein